MTATTETGHPTPADALDAAAYAEAHGLLLVVDIPETEGITLNAQDVRESWDECQPGQSVEWVRYITPEEHAEAECQSTRRAAAAEEAAQARRALEAARRPVFESMRQCPGALADVLVELARVLSDGRTAGQVGPHMTCAEADAVAEVLLLSGHPDAAEKWLDGHARGDDDEDDEHRDRETAPELAPV